MLTLPSPGSERARTARTAGQTLAEAGKINESLMYLGQCMQLQSDNSTDPSRPQNIVPFRQCKLTELLFSNSYPSSNSKSDHSSRKAPQKAIMIVTADPLGDFNATSQILRYSALAREVTVPRVPSITSTIVHSIPSSTPRPGTAMSIASTTTSGRTTPALTTQMEAELQQAFAEIALLREELEVQGLRLEEETNRRQQAEHSWRQAESRLDAVEQEVREEVWSEMEAKLYEEQRRWRLARENDREDGEAFVDRKLEILTQGMDDVDVNDEDVDIYEDEEPSMFERTEELEEENAMLRERLREMEREKERLRSPSKKMRVLKQRRWEGSEVALDGST